MVNVRFDGRGIGAQLLSGHHGRLFGLLDNPLMDLLSALLAKERKRPTQITEIGNRVLIKTGEAPIEKAGSQFAMKLAVGPSFEVFEHHTTQQPVRSDPLAAGLVGGSRR